MMKINWCKILGHKWNKSSDLNQSCKRCKTIRYKIFSGYANKDKWEIIK